MRAGGSGAKGAAFERTVAMQLSLWITEGKRKDALRRNILSGGRWTTGAAKGELHGVPGDLAISHPLAAAFCSTFLIECKHYKKLDWDTFFYKTGSSFLHKVIKGCQAQAEQSGLAWIIIAKQNMKPPMAIMSYEIGMAANDAQSEAFDFHIMHNMEYMLIPLDDLLTKIDAAVFVTLASEFNASTS